MAQPSTGVVPLLSGMLAAAALSGAAVLVVLDSGCDDPGSYHEHDGVVELIGGCLQPSDLPVAPRDPADSSAPGGADPSLAR
ncbi:hypothetical protein EIL87_15855 [Saccharopolyspora rhizosphaerae]|uniref:Secreted protein n=1 Tax=Saccharopolyspora rhizosphaerae TaxID=2492662 RepID=A0A426JQT9_9PSEU|nr:hypothetical protein [Saccharopolyspora rhizosphaerae]RRO15514.1 hypothetical protein EIL87_15855 [Saccharopolyspora rhizosphaerae]